jgi:murein DD-endopeptidase MepM/ murein hydrolase activator NlpD
VSRGISARLFYGLFAGLLGTNVLTAVAFMMSPDIAGLMSGQNDLVLGAYEDRIAQLRVEVDRLHSRHYAQAGDINLQLQELAQQQEVLTEQHQYVKLLAEKASELGIDTASLPPVDGSEDGDDDTPALVTGSLGGAPGSPGQQIEDAGNTLHQMMGDTQMALAALSEAATSSTDEIMTELRRVGITPKLPAEDAVGGPLLPPQDGPEADSLVDDANAVMDALTRFKAAKAAVDTAPIHRPVVGSMRVSSGFGNRTDPFTRGKAFHAGIDFPEPTGTMVLSAGDGVVSFVGQRSGYGNVVEVDHGGGLITRYGHLSAFLVKEGQKVETGTPIAKVGSTGRSTGPHLHFEVRRNDTAIDPGPFLAAGKHLQRFLV